MTNPSYPALASFKQSFQRGIGVASLLLASLGFLAGCGGMLNDASTASATGVALRGNVHGGQQPVVGATIQLYAAQASGYAAAAVPLISSSVTTDSGGGFTITGDYICPASPNDQVYLVATGGNPGAGVNPNLALMTALGPCSGLSGSTFISVNEATTVASVYALSGFMADYAHVGTSSTNYIGLVNAMATVNNLVNTADGTVNAATPAYKTVPTGATGQTFSSTVPQSEINTLANIIAACVNSGVGVPSTNCTNLFASTATNTTTGGVSGTPDTIQATLNIAHNPAANIAALFGFAASNPPFAPALTTAPNDWSISVNFIGGGLGGKRITASQNNQANSTALAIDATGDIWVTNGSNNTVTELNNLGAPLSPNSTITPLFKGGYPSTLSDVSAPLSIAVDLSGNVWVGNSNGHLSEFSPSGVETQSVNSGGLVSSNLKGIAIDASNNVWVADQNDGGGLVAAFNNSGTPLSFSPVTGQANPSGAIAIDDGGFVWIANSGVNANVVKINGSTGSAVAQSGNQLSGALGTMIIDASGNAWIPELNACLVWNVTTPGIVFETHIYNNAFGVSNPGGISIDGAGNVWVDSQGAYAGQSPNPNLVAELPNGNLLTNEPSVGFGVGSSLSSPLSLGIDRSGNVWVLNGANSSFVTEFVGIAAPSYTPLAAAVKNTAIGHMP